MFCKVGKMPSRARSPWLRPLFFCLAVLFLIEAWLWKHLGPAVRWLAGLVPFQRLKDMVARWAQALPPYGALALFVIPMLLAEPLYLAAAWSFTHHHWSLGVAFVVAEKLFVVGGLAFLYGVCEPQLRAIPWFARLIDLFLRWKAWAEAEVEPFKQAVLAMMHRLSGSGSLFRHISALRRRIGARQ